MREASNEKSEIVYKTVLQAVAESRPDADTEICHLNRVPENGLDQFSKDQIVQALNRLSETDRVIVYHPPGDPSQKNMIQAMRALTEKLPEEEAEESSSYQLWPKRDARNYEFLFIKKREFDRWYKVRLLEKVGSFETMDNLNKEKIRITLLDIEEKLQINPSEFLKIPLLFQRDTSLIKDNSKTGSYRIEALKFLTYRGIVKSFEIPKDGSDSEISIVLDAPRFIRFKEELEKIYGFGSQKKLVEEISSPVEVEVIGLPQKKSNHPATGSPVQDASVVENSFVEEITFEIVYTEKREVLVNEKYFTKTDLGGENDLVLSYLMKKENQNRLVSMKEILEVLGAGSLKKSLRKIAENLKFKGVLLNAFFETSRGGIVFRNPVSIPPSEASKIKWPSRLPKK